MRRAASALGLLLALSPVQADTPYLRPPKEVVEILDAPAPPRPPPPPYFVAVARSPYGAPPRCCPSCCQFDWPPLVRTLCPPDLRSTTLTRPMKCTPAASNEYQPAPRAPRP